MAKMKKEELLSVVSAEISAVEDVSELQHERQKAMEYYLGEPLGTEVEGRSKFVSTDVRDVISWQMPSLMRIFGSTNKVVCFEPTGPEDEAAAKQETEAVNHTFYKENNGWSILYTFFKDALLQKNGIVKYWWDGDVKKTREEYQALNEMELAELVNNDDINVVEYEEMPTDIGMLYNVTVIETNRSGCVRVANVPPEEFFISADATSIDPKSASFVCHRTLKTRSELMEMGFSKRLVNSLPTHDEVQEEEEYARDNYHEKWSSPTSKASQRIRYDECYLRVDFDGDGIAELREVAVAGNKVMVNREIDEVPFAAICPNVLSHKFYGLSSADETMELQMLRSTLLRGVLDNTYNANNARTVVQEGRVNMDDLLTSRPGGIVRCDGPPQQSLMPLPHNPLPAQTYQVLEQIDKIRKERTGVSDESMGLDANTLAHARTGAVSQSFDNSRLKIELIARTFAETGVKDLFLGIHKILQQNQDKAKWIRMRGEWVSVNPREWKERGNMTVNVGLGTGNKDREIQGLQTLLSIQKELLGAGKGVTEKNIYDTLEKLVEAYGYGSVDIFFTDPSTQQDQQKGPSPEQLLVQAQVELAQAQMKATTFEAETNRMEAMNKHSEKMKELDEKDARERTKMELEYQQNIQGSLV